MPSRTSGPANPMNSSASEVSKVGPARRNQLLSAYLVQRMAVCEPAASRSAISKARLTRLRLRHRQGHQPDPLGLLARHRFAQQQVILGLGHAAQQRPDDRSMVPGRHAQPGMAVDDARVPGRDRDIRQQAGHQPRAHRRAMHGADNGLVAVDEVVDQVARLVPDAGAHLEVIGHLLDQVQVAAGREAPALAADQRHAHRWLGRHVAPDLGQARDADRRRRWTACGWPTAPPPSRSRGWGRAARASAPGNGQSVGRASSWRDEMCIKHSGSGRLPAWAPPRPCGSGARPPGRCRSREPRHGEPER